MALAGPKKAVLSAGTTLLTKMAARNNKKANADAEGLKKQYLLPTGKRERVFGVYIAFKPRNMAIREMKNEAGEAHFELWDTDKNSRLI
jgi:hypothetical protein